MVDLANMETVEKECGALGGLFQAIVNDMKVNKSLFFPRLPLKHTCVNQENDNPVREPVSPTYMF